MPVQNRADCTEIPSITAHQARLLVVDDIDVNRKLISSQLGRHGYEIILAENGPAALKIIEEQELDLVLLDIRMPGMDGLEVLRRLRKTHSELNLPVIMVTAEAVAEITVEALQLGANDYLVKPIDVGIAVARIETQLNLAHMAAIKDDIVRFASHDLKKPLIVMLDIAQVMRENLQPGQTVREEDLELLDMLLQTGHNMQGLINGFLDQEVLRQNQERENYQPLDINKIALSSVTSNTGYAKRKEIALKHDFKPDIPMVTANEFRLLQILDNLIGNALKFCSEGSTVEVSTGVRDNEVFVKITDNGPGLSENDFPKLFIKHAKLSNQPTGGETSSGVGLALCKQLVKLDKGNIGARNNSGAGATFWISLPINQALI